MPDRSCWINQGISHINIEYFGEDIIMTVDIDPTIAQSNGLILVFI